MCAVLAFWSPLSPAIVFSLKYNSHITKIHPFFKGYDSVDFSMFRVMQPSHCLQNIFITPFLPPHNPWQPIIIFLLWIDLFYTRSRKWNKYYVTSHIGLTLLHKVHPPCLMNQCFIFLGLNIIPLYELHHIWFHSPAGEQVCCFYFMTDCVSSTSSSCSES